MSVIAEAGVPVPPAEGRQDPVFAATPWLIDYDEPARLDPALTALTPGESDSGELIPGELIPGELAPEELAPGELAPAEPSCSAPARRDPVLAIPSVDAAADEDAAILDEKPPPERAPMPWPGPTVSLVLHAAVALLILTANTAPAGQGGAIPVQLLLEPPPAPPKLAPKPSPPAAPKPAPEPPKPPPTPPKPAHATPGPLASANFAPDATPTPPKPPQPETPAPVPQPEEAPKPSPVAPAPIPAPPPPKPAPPRPDAAAVPPPPPPPPKPMPPSLARQGGAERHAEREEVARTSSPPARYPGPAATRDAYLAYLVTLTRQHLDLLPRAFVGTRRGETKIGVVVLDDGTIAQLAIVQSSGYPDIDRKIEAMVKAVGKFPPLPQWYQGDSMELEFQLQFPGALDR